MEAFKYLQLAEERSVFSRWSCRGALAGQWVVARRAAVRRAAVQLPFP